MRKNVRRPRGPSEPKSPGIFSVEVDRGKEGTMRSHIETYLQGRALKLLLAALVALLTVAGLAPKVGG